MTDPTPDFVRAAILKAADALATIPETTPHNVRMPLALADWKLREAMHSVDAWQASLEGRTTSQTATKAEPPTIADLAMLVGRLVHQLGKHEPDNPVLQKAMDYLRRKDLAGSVLREIEKKTEVPE